MYSLSTWKSTLDDIIATTERDDIDSKGSSYKFNTLETPEFRSSRDNEQPLHTPHETLDNTDVSQFRQVFKKHLQTELALKLRIDELERKLARLQSENSSKTIEAIVHNAIHEFLFTGQLSGTEGQSALCDEEIKSEIVTFDSVNSKTSRALQRIEKLENDFRALKEFVNNSFMKFSNKLKAQQIAFSTIEEQMTSSLSDISQRVFKSEQLVSERFSLLKREHSKLENTNQKRIDSLENDFQSKLEEGLSNISMEIEEIHEKSLRSHQMNFDDRFRIYEEKIGRNDVAQSIQELQQDQKTTIRNIEHFSSSLERTSGELSNLRKKYLELERELSKKQDCSSNQSCYEKIEEKVNDLSKDILCVNDSLAKIENTIHENKENAVDENEILKEMKKQIENMNKKTDELQEKNLNLKQQNPMEISLIGDLKLNLQKFTEKELKIDQKIVALQSQVSTTNESQESLNVLFEELKREYTKQHEEFVLKFTEAQNSYNFLRSLINKTQNEQNDSEKKVRSSDEQIRNTNPIVSPSFLASNPTMSSKRTSSVQGMIPLSVFVQGKGSDNWNGFPNPPKKVGNSNEQLQSCKEESSFLHKSQQNTQFEKFSDDEVESEFAEDFPSRKETSSRSDSHPENSDEYYEENEISDLFSDSETPQFKLNENELSEKKHKTEVGQFEKKRANSINLTVSSPNKRPPRGTNSIEVVQLSNQPQTESPTLQKKKSFFGRFFKKENKK